MTASPAGGPGQLVSLCDRSSAFVNLDLWVTQQHYFGYRKYTSSQAEKRASSLLVGASTRKFTIPARMCLSRGGVNGNSEMTGGGILVCPLAAGD